jgi:hypothetical protein
MILLAHNRNSSTLQVMGFCSDEEYREFLESCPLFERMLVRSGAVLLPMHSSPAPERMRSAVVAITTVTRTSQTGNVCPR